MKTAESLHGHAPDSVVIGYYNKAIGAARSPKMAAQIALSASKFEDFRAGMLSYLTFGLVPASANRGYRTVTETAMARASELCLTSQDALDTLKSWAGTHVDCKGDLTGAPTFRGGQAVLDRLARQAIAGSKTAFEVSQVSQQLANLHIPPSVYQGEASQRLVSLSAAMN